MGTDERAGMAPDEGTAGRPRPTGPVARLMSWVGRQAGDLALWTASSPLQRALRQRKYARLIRRSGLLDVEHYLAQCPPGAPAPRDPVMHYLRHGEAAGLSPNAYFDAAWYLRSQVGAADARAAGKSPLVHYIRWGSRWHLSPGPDFDVRHYLGAYPDVATSGLSPLGHYLAIGRREGRARLPPGHPGASPHEVAPRPPLGASAEVPFAYPANLPSPPPRLAVMLHLFHVDLAGEFKGYLANVAFPFDLFATTDTQGKATWLEQEFRDWPHGKVEIRVAENRGRDIAPKLVALRDVYERYDFVLHLHGKKSKHLSDLEPWRAYLLDTLVGSPEIVRSVFEIFAQGPRVGLVAPQHFEPVRHCIGWGENRARGMAVGRTMGLTLETDRIDFPSGSMFWARTAALRPLLGLELSTSDFEAEEGQIDGTLAHVVERLYFVACERAGYTWLKIARRHLLPTTPGLAEIRSAAALRRFIAEGTLPLTAASPPPPRTASAGVERVPAAPRRA